MSSARQMPFLLKFGEQITAPSHPPVMRHDPVRQIMQVHQDGAWIDAIDAREVRLEAATKVTDVRQETTDDD